MKNFILVEESVVAEDLAASAKPPILGSVADIPLGNLSDRQFECLLQDLFRHPVAPAEYCGLDYDQVLLMQGVGERGRDCLFTKEGRNVGLIQCKRYSERLSKPAAAREIIKFCLHVLLDDSLIDSTGRFFYIMACSGDFSEPSKLLLANFANLSSEDNLGAWINEVRLESKVLSALCDDNLRGKVLEIAGRLVTIAVGPSDICTLTFKYPHLLEKYFTILKVVDNRSVEDLHSSVQLLLKNLTDDEVRRLTDSLAEHSSDFRADFGICSFWGYPRKFISYLLRENTFREVFFRLNTAKAEWDRLFLDYLNQLIHEEIFRSLTSKRRWSPLTLSAAAPYLFARISRLWSLSIQGKEITKMTIDRSEFPRDIVSVREEVIRAGVAYLNDDWSRVVGDEELLILKRSLFRHMYGCYHNRAEMEKTFDLEWRTMSHDVDEIEGRIAAVIPQFAKIVLGGSHIFDDGKRLLEIFGDLAQLAPEKKN